MDCGGNKQGKIIKKHNDIGNTRKLNDVAIEQIHNLKNTFHRINATFIHYKLIEDGYINEKNISISTVQRFIRNNDLKSARNINIKDRKAFEEEFSTEMYQGDTCYGSYITENGKCRRTYLIMLIDDKSRLIVGSRFFYNDNAYNFQKVLKEAVARYRIPNKLYIDYTEENTMPKFLFNHCGIFIYHIFFGIVFATNQESKLLF